MPVNTYQLRPAQAGNPGYAVAKVLATATVNQFGAVRGVRVGVGDGSCCAAVAVVPGPGFPAVGNVGGTPFGVAYGNSAMIRGGLVVENVGSHAERAALTAAGANGLALFLLPGTNHAVIFIELAPCPGCATWLAGGGGGVANPYAANLGPAGPITLNAWYGWPYPAGVGNMQAFHTTPVGAQQATVNGW